MKTTTLILEYLVTGIITLIALFYILYVVCPKHEVLLLESIIKEFAGMGNLFLIILLSISYCLGIAIETSALSVFENILHKRSVERLPQYYKENEEILKLSPFFEGINFLAISEKQARKIYGQLRFVVLSKDANLYKEIESQISRMRLIRVLFILEFIFFIGAVILIIQGDNSMMLAVFTTVLFLLLYSTFEAVIIRFDRYFRAIERAYIIVGIS